MADSIWFPDGTSAVLVYDRNDPTGLYAFLDIIEDRLGRDAVDFARNLIEPSGMKKDMQALEQELEGYESSLEHHRDLLLDVQEELRELCGRIAIKDRKATREYIVKILNAQIEKIYKEL